MRQLYLILFSIFGLFLYNPAFLIAAGMMEWWVQKQMSKSISA